LVVGFSIKKASRAAIAMQNGHWQPSGMKELVFPLLADEVAPIDHAHC